MTNTIHNIIIFMQSYDHDLSVGQLCTGDDKWWVCKRNRVVVGRANYNAREIARKQTESEMRDIPTAK